MANSKGKGVATNESSGRDKYICFKFSEAKIRGLSLCKKNNLHTRVEEEKEEQSQKDAKEETSFNYGV